MVAAEWIEGGCLCGRVRYRAPADLADLNNCHCIDCRRASGAPFVTWGTVPSNRLIVTGELRRVAHANRIRCFAACCGTPLFFLEAADAPTTDIAVATLDDPTPHAPESNLWIEDRLPWAALDPELPAYPGSSSSARQTNPGPGSTA